MDNKKEKAPGDSSSEDPSAVSSENIEHLKFQSLYFQNNKAKNMQLPQNPATVAEIYRNTMKKPGEILVSKLHANTSLKHDK